MGNSTSFILIISSLWFTIPAVAGTSAGGENEPVVAEDCAESLRAISDNLTLIALIEFLRGYQVLSRDYEPEIERSKIGEVFAKRQGIKEWWGQAASAHVNIRMPDSLDRALTRFAAIHSISRSTVISESIRFMDRIANQVEDVRFREICSHGETPRRVGMDAVLPDQVHNTTHKVVADDKAMLAALSIRAGNKMEATIVRSGLLKIFALFNFPDQTGK